MTVFANNLEKLLKANSISQKKLCEIAGVGKSAYNNWRDKDAMPSADTTVKIARFLGTSVEYLVTGEDPQGITSDELQLINKWRIIGAESRRTALLIIDDAYNKAIAEQKEKKDTA